MLIKALLDIKKMTKN